MDVGPSELSGLSADLALRLHHVGHAVADVNAATSHYRRCFGYRAVSHPIHDPVQTAHVQFLTLPPDPLYLELVAPDSAGSKLSSFVKRGGGLHHLCYTAPSLQDAVQLLSVAGMRAITDPEPAVAFGGRRICWLLGADRSLVELIERRDAADLCTPG